MAKIYIGYDAYGIEGVNDDFIHFVFDMTLSYTAGDQDSEAGLVVSTNDYLQTLNYKYRGKDKPTNVLSFSNEETEKFISTPEDNNYLGDIYISREYVAQEASKLNISHKERFTHLLVHGLLHLMGFDHEDAEAADVMQNMEDKIVRSIF